MENSKEHADYKTTEKRRRQKRESAKRCRERNQREVEELERRFQRNEQIIDELEKKAVQLTDYLLSPPKKLSSTSGKADTKRLCKSRSDFSEKAGRFGGDAF